MPGDVVDRILANAIRAPSAGFSQGWAFLALEGAEQTRRFWKSVDTGRQPHDRVYNAPLIIVCLSHKQAYLDRYAESDKGWEDRAEERWPVPYWNIDTGFAALLMLLTAVDQGLGALFFGIFPGHIDRLRDTFGVPDEYQPIGAIAVGYAAADEAPSGSWTTRPRRPVEAVVHRGRW